MSIIEILEDYRITAAQHDISDLPHTDLSDWRATAAEPVDSVFHEGLAVGTMGLLSAEGGCGKSFLALQLALSVALGRELVSGFNPQAQGRVLCLFAEDDRRIISRRLAAIADGLGIPDADIDRALSQIDTVAGTSSPLLRNGAHTNAYFQLHETCEQSRYRLVVVDPLIAFAGIENENDNAQMQAAALAIVDLAKVSRGAALVLHHNNKQSQLSGNLSQASTRGASSLINASRWAVNMRNLTEKEMGKLSINPALHTDYIETYQSKNSYAPRDGRRRYLQRVEGGALVPVDLQNENGPRILSALCLELATGKYNITHREIRNGNTPLSETLRERVGQAVGAVVGRGKLIAAVDMGLENGDLIRGTDPRNSKRVPIQCSE